MVFMILGLFGGLGMFIYGMHLMSDGLKIVAGNKMRQFLEMFTNTPLKALLSGIIVTIMVQSSSTTTVMVVGFVNASLMTLTQAAGIILGSNIGTTVMAQIIAFDITAYSSLFIGLGTFIALFSKRKKARDWGSILLGFGILFFGVTLMSQSVAPLEDSPEFVDILLTYGKNPLLGLLASALMTAVLQSSGAIIGLVQALAISGVFSSTTGTEAIQICIPLVIGSNIGTCVTALLSAIGTSNVAKDAAYIHLFINIFGALWVMLLLFILNSTLAVDPIYQWIVNISGTTTLNGTVVPNIARQIAMAHTIFNVANTIVLFPLLKPIVKLVEKILPPEQSEEGLHLDERLLNTPPVALGQAEEELVKMSRLTAKNFERGIDSLILLDEKMIEKVKEKENSLNEFESGILDFSARLSLLNLSQEQNERAAYIIENAHYLERIGDIAENLSNLAMEMIERDKHFTENMIKAMEELKVRIGKILNQVTQILSDPTNETINKIYKNEDFLNNITNTLRDNRMKNLTGKEEKIYATFIFIELLNNIERATELAENIANSTVALQEETNINPLSEVIY